MEFTDYTNAWAKSEVYQGKWMIGIGILIAIAFGQIFRSDNILLKGTLVPAGLLLAILLGYGSYIIYSRPAHAKEMIRIYQHDPEEAIKIEMTKHIKDNKAGNMLMRTYPVLMLISIVALWLVTSSYFKGMTVGFAILFISAFIIDNGFVSRSNAFIAFLNSGPLHTTPTSTR
jgi:hypothetical protein